ncbi:cytochrome P450 [Myxococcota bacterium]|nr:cytochrome P450 [Myxococcota bacterium]
MSQRFDFDPVRIPQPADPYPLYRRLREEHPLYQVSESGVYCLSRHRDISFALRHPEIFSSEAMRTVLMSPDQTRVKWRDFPTLARFLFQARVNPLRMSDRRKGLVESDPPEHDALRSIVNRGFTPRRIGEWELRAKEIVSQCMSRIDEDQPFDVMQELAIPLPVTVIAEMLGVEPDRKQDFKRWGDAVVAASTGQGREAGLAALLAPMGELRAYLRGVIRSRQQQPAHDLISVLLERRSEGALDEEQLFGFIMLLLIAGNETTTNLIGNTTLALLAHPEQLDLLHREPHHLPALVEEALRYDSPVQSLFRQTTREVEVSGGTIPAGAPVALLMGSANRDDEIYHDPDRFDVTRNSPGHLAFGFGVHFCLGASLARLEAKVALEALIPALRNRRAAGGATEWVDSFTVRGPRALWLEPAPSPIV